VLAQGGSEELAAYTLITRGQVNIQPLNSSGFGRKGEISAARKTMEVGHVLSTSPVSPDPTLEDCSDWRLLKSFGATWILISPLASGDLQNDKLLGAVLVTGRGSVPTINADWLQEWSYELAQAIAHASVYVMECSLDMLRLVFPPRMVESLVLNAISAAVSSPQGSGTQDVADKMVQSALLHTTESPPTAAPATAITTRDSSLPGIGSRPKPGRDRLDTRDLGGMHAADMLADAVTVQLNSMHQTQNLNQTHPRQHRERSDDHDFDISDEGALQMADGVQGSMRSKSPFALASQPSQANRRSSSLGSSDGRQGSSKRTPHSGTAPSSNQIAAAVLREASVQSQTSLFFSDSTTNLPMSPANSEVEGFEDILKEDAKHHASRRPSFRLDRAHSRDSRNSSGDPPGSGSPTTTGGAQTPSAHQPHIGPGPPSTAAAALIASNATEATENAPGRPSTPSIPHASMSSGGDNNVQREHVGVPDNSFMESAEEREGDQKKGKTMRNEYAGELLTTISEGTPSNQTSDAATKLGPLSCQSPASFSGSGSIFLSAMNPQYGADQLQEWDLRFTDPGVEWGFVRYAGSWLARVDALGGAGAIFGWLASFFLNPGAYLRHAAWSLLSLSFSATLCIPIIAAVLAPGWWAERRLMAVPMIKILLSLVILLYGRLLGGTVYRSARFGTLCSMALGASSLLMPLPLRIHIPVQLLCMWAAVEPSFQNFIISFMLPTTLLYVGEAMFRRRFVATSLAKARNGRSKADFGTESSSQLKNE
jgi:hypothetical protein